MFDVGLLPLILEGADVIELRQNKQPHPIEIARLGNPKRDSLIQSYLQQLKTAGFSSARQGIWMQAGDRLLVANGGDKLYSGASLTKAATTLAALHRYDANHRFTTQVSYTGSLVDGTLEGDLIIEGGMDLLLMPKQAIALGNQLEDIGIRYIDGDLVVLYPYQSALPDPKELGLMLQNALHAGFWSEENYRHYAQHMPDANKPGILISGSVKTVPDLLSVPQELIAHQSPTVIEMLKYMNLHSSNDLAESFVADMGGEEAMVEAVLSISGLPAEEIQLKNGSGLGEENQMTPRAVVGIFIAIQDRLESLNLDLQDVFPVSGQDIGTLEDRNIPKGAVVKTGTLWNVSALAGYVPTEKEGRVWFAIMNEGGDYIDGFRKLQDQVLTQLVQYFADKPASN